MSASVRVRPRPSASVRVRPRPSASVRVRPRPSASVRVRPRPSASVRFRPRPSASVRVRRIHKALKTYSMSLHVHFLENFNPKNYDFSDKSVSCRVMHKSFNNMFDTKMCGTSWGSRWCHYLFHGSVGL